MERFEALFEVVVLELAHARLRQRFRERVNSSDDREFNLERVITAKAHA